MLENLEEKKVLFLLYSFWWIGARPTKALDANLLRRRIHPDSVEWVERKHLPYHNFGYVDFQVARQGFDKLVREPFVR